MKIPRLVAPASASRDTAQAGQTARARTLDEAIAWNLKEFGYGG
jgi:hypothetical protein